MLMLMLMLYVNQVFEQAQHVVSSVNLRADDDVDIEIDNTSFFLFFFFFFFNIFFDYLCIFFFIDHAV